MSSSFDTYLNRLVAVKELKPTAVRNPDLLRAFLTEAKLIGFLDHPGVVPIYDTYLLERNTPCYTMRLIEGRTGYERFGGPPQGPGEIMERLGALVKLFETLSYVHDKGVLHLDIKPENIMIGPHGQVLLMDWGNARVFDPAPYREYLTTYGDGTESGWNDEETEGMILGTPAYMSPEQTCSLRTELTPASDVFSAGIVFYEWLAGEHPFMVEDHDRLLRRIREHEPVPMDRINPELPKRLAQIGASMLEKDRARRYPDFHAVLAEIRELQRSGAAFATRTFAAGDTIFTEGDPGEFACIILSGRVEVIRCVDGERRVLATLGPNQIVGELAVFSDVARTATVVAAEPTCIRIMARSDIEQELQKLSPWVGEMISGLCGRFIGLSDKLLESSRGDP